MTINDQKKQPIFKPSDRISSFKPYFFASLAKRISSLQNEGMDVIRIDMGSPDLPPEKFIIDKLVEKVYQPNNHGYTPMGGGPEFREAISQYYKKRFGVQIDPVTEAIGLIGSKEGLFHLAQIIINPGDIALVPDPGYPVYSASIKIAGGEIFRMPLLKENKFLPDLSKIPDEIARKAKLIWINYPNNPTGATATKEFFTELVEFATRYEIIIAHDAPYTEVCFDGYIAPSLMELPGAKEISVEFNSLSKSYNMAGWRLGMAVGQSEIIRYLHTYKSQLDSSTFSPILESGVIALTGDQSWIQKRNDIYKLRRDIVVDGLRLCGFEVDTPPAAIYVWAKLPNGANDSMRFCEKMLSEIGVSTTPGIVYGEYGEGYLRISLGTETTRIQEAIERIIHWKM
ncbi:MAG: aminotransferase class I/II-fold pyridoxal phosphate-dependent enzyme [Anaerolineaceae bacterium]|nr:aminotransferase class I/II-fold pyridoxal phosphate-dependent enzyme [Anaerolineaceae bacterium]